MHTVTLKVEQDHVESLAKVRNPLVAIEELIWNGLDADAKRVDVELVLNKLGGLAKIRVKDNGFGIEAAICDHAFGSLGGSPKMKINTTPGGRVPHGKSGKGRFRVFGVGRKVTWVSRYKSNGQVKEYMIKGFRSTLKEFEVGDEKDAKSKQTGVEVTIDDIEENFPSLLDSQQAAEELSRRLALYLKKYPGIEINYDGHCVDPSALESHTATYEVSLEDKKGRGVPATVTVIEWKTPTERALYFCDESGFTLEERSPGIQAPGFHFTAYLRSSLIPELVDEGAFGLEPLHPVVNSMLETAKETLRSHFRARESSP